MGVKGSIPHGGAVITAVVPGATGPLRVERPSSRPCSSIERPPLLTALDLALAQSTRSYPSVSVLVNRTESASMDAARLRSLLATTRDRLDREDDAGSLASLLSALDELAAGVELGPGAAAVALFASVSTARSVMLPLPVEERVVIDETFATRDLVRGLQRCTRAWVLVLDERVTRLYEALGPYLAQVHGGGFPLVRDDAAETVRMGLRRDRSQRDRGWRRYATDVDEVLGAHLVTDPGPLILVGDARRAQAFTQHSAAGAAVTGVLPVIPVDTGDAAIAALVGPLLIEGHRARQAAAIAELDAYAGSRCADGIDAAWAHAGEGRGELLVVEESYAPAALVNGGRLHPTADPEHPEATDDVVDELVEAVLAGRGRAVFVPDGTLTGRGRVALRLRW